MSKLTRRDFLASSALLTTGLLIPNFKNSGNLSLFPSSVVAAPLTYTNESSGYSTTLTFNATNSKFSLSSSDKVYYSIRSYNPNGHLIWSHDIAINPLHSTSLNLPKDLGWASLAIHIENIPTGHEANLDSVVYIKSRGPRGEDGHHLVQVHQNSSCSHTIPVPKENQQILLSMQNPSSNACDGIATLYSEDGKVFFEKKIRWNGFQSYYFLFGDNSGNLPNNTFEIKNELRPLTLVLKIEDSRTIMTSFRMLSKNGQLLMSHGISEKKVPKWGSQKIDSSVADQQALSMNSSQILTLDSNWYPSDLVHFNNRSLKSILAVPNLTNSKIYITPLIVNSFGKISSKENVIKPLEIRPWGMGVVDLHKDVFPSDFNVEENYSVVCHVGQKQRIAAAVKVWSYDEENRMIIQHLRPQENIQPSTPLPTDYWVSTGDIIHKKIQFLIRNVGVNEATDALLQLIGEGGITNSINLQKIPPGGFILTDSEIKERTLSVRLVSQSSHLTISKYSINDNFPSAMHGINCI